MHDDGLRRAFAGLEDTDHATVDKTLPKKDFPEIKSPAGIVCMLQLAPPASPSLAYATLKVVERIAFISHRNQALLNESGVAGILFQLLRSTPPRPVEEIVVMSKTLKRLLDMGARPDEARAMFRSVLKPEADGPSNYHLDSEVLEQLKIGMRSAGKWPSFIAFGSGGEARAGLELPNAHLQGRTFPGSTGLTFLVSAPPPLYKELRVSNCSPTGVDLP